MKTGLRIHQLPCRRFLASVTARFPLPGNFILRPELLGIAPIFSIENGVCFFFLTAGVFAAGVFPVSVLPEPSPCLAIFLNCHAMIIPKHILFHLLLTFSQTPLCRKPTFRMNSGKNTPHFWAGISMNSCVFQA